MIYINNFINAEKFGLVDIFNENGLNPNEIIFRPRIFSLVKEDFNLEAINIISLKRLFKYKDNERIINDEIINSPLGFITSHYEVWKIEPGEYDLLDKIDDLLDKIQEISMYSQYEDIKENLTTTLEILINKSRDSELYLYAAAVVAWLNDDYSQAENFTQKAICILRNRYPQNWEMDDLAWILKWLLKVCASYNLYRSRAMQDDILDKSINTNYITLVRAVGEFEDGIYHWQDAIYNNLIDTNLKWHNGSKGYFLVNRVHSIPSVTQTCWSNLVAVIPETTNIFIIVGHGTDKSGLKFDFFDKNEFNNIKRKELKLEEVVRDINAITGIKIVLFLNCFVDEMEIEDLNAYAVNSSKNIGSEYCYSLAYSFLRISLFESDVKVIFLISQILTTIYTPKGKTMNLHIGVNEMIKP